MSNPNDFTPVIVEEPVKEPKVLTPVRDLTPAEARTLAESSQAAEFAEHVASRPAPKKTVMEERKAKRAALLQEQSEAKTAFVQAQEDVRTAPNTQARIDATAEQDAAQKRLLDANAAIDKFDADLVNPPEMVAAEPTTQHAKNVLASMLHLHTPREELDKAKLEVAEADKAVAEATDDKREVALERKAAAYARLEKAKQAFDNSQA